MFKINDKVKIIKDLNGGWFVGCEGVIEEINEELYGLKIYKLNEVFESVDMDVQSDILYFNADELELVKGE